ncbi:hypothetical protein [Alteribacillus sp. YIM 98480]|uniref:hypothetical protein n=1 Tax=Alteribacillus sp. YIM 98480 TaxID=2606599 RepID=UPI00131BFDAB|nr:hypothetical protein [Alteribacillus sp. YIM 98480]
MSSSSAYYLEIPSVRQWKAQISFQYADPPGIVAREQGACAFLNSILAVTIGQFRFIRRGTNIDSF